MAKMSQSIRDRISKSVGKSYAAAGKKVAKGSGKVWVEGYTRKDGVKVPGHMRKPSNTKKTKAQKNARARNVARAKRRKASK